MWSRIYSKTLWKKTTWQNNLPGLKENPVAHIRPKAKDGNDKVELPDGQLITKQAYWLNAKYIGEILNDLPAVSRQYISENHGNYFSNGQIEKLRNVINNPIYTVEDFRSIADECLGGFTLQEINKTLLEAIGYKIDSHFILDNQFNDANDYFEKKIFQHDYFQVPNNNVYQEPFVKRKIENLENAFRIVKIEGNMYITDTCLKKANVQKDLFLSYKNAVEQFIDGNVFFTLSSIKKKGFEHRLEEFGFENLFYESILKRPGRLKYLNLQNQMLFRKTPFAVTNTDLLAEIFENQDFMSLDDVLYELKSRWDIQISFDSAVLLAKSTDFYYSEELEKVFENKDLYYQYVFH
ncbi:hypothetical protein [Bacillus sp. B15-48]|uniref:hypothetical protein n=1 Tax=Bacillus sp. B15-48 TaxID=1548601 RepID=UPI00193F6FB6|nr:hypothetical protein [Bacillus sp. B15-48]MBM4765112.1 hypothetical protein [Bacillus sp. B15-48]